MLKIKHNATAVRLKNKLEQKQSDNLKMVILLTKIVYGEIDHIERMLFEAFAITKDLNKDNSPYSTECRPVLKVKYKTLPIREKLVYKLPMLQSIEEIVIKKVENNPADTMELNDVKKFLKIVDVSNQKLFFDNKEKLFNYYKPLLTTKNFELFKKTYDNLYLFTSHAYGEHLERQYGQMFNYFNDLAKVLVNEYLQEIKKISTQYDKALKLITHAYKYLYYAVDRLVNDKDTLHSFYIINKNGEKELSLFALEKIITFSQEPFELILKFADQAITTKKIKDINIRKAFSNVFIQCLEARKLLWEFLNKKKLVDIQDTTTLISAFSDCIGEIKEQLTTMFFVEEARDNTKIKNKLENISLLANKHYKKLLAEEERNKQIRQAKMDKLNAAKKTNQEDFTLTTEPDEDIEDETHEILTPKPQISTGEKNLQEGRKSLNSIKNYNAAIDNFTAARSFFAEINDFENELEAMVGIADSKLCFANQLLKNAMLKSNRLKTPDLLEKAQELYLEATENYKEIIKLTPIENIKEIYYLNVESCENGLVKIRSLIEANTRYLIESEEKYREICKEQKIKLAFKTILQEEIIKVFPNISITDPVRHDYNAAIYNNLTYYMSTTSKKYWDIEYLFHGFDQFRLENFDFSFDNILSKGEELWRNNPKYKGIDKKNFFKKIKERETYINKEILKKYEKLEQENIIIKEKIGLIKNEIELIKNEYHSLQSVTASSKPINLAPDSPWTNLEKLKLIKYSDLTGDECHENNALSLIAHSQCDVQFSGVLEVENQPH
jgi:hypothetical protein